MSARPITENTLFYGDNLFILREHIPSESVDLIYLDPPFNSNRSYNVLFKDESGTESEAQITAFEDTWHWNIATERTYAELRTEAPDHVAKMIESLHEFIGANQMMAYCHLSGYLRSLPNNMPRCQALSVDWLCPIKWRDIIFLVRYDFHRLFCLCIFYPCQHMWQKCQTYGSRTRSESQLIRQITIRV